MSTTVPWDFSTPREGRPTRPNLPTPEGEALGREFARLAAPAIEADRKRFPKGRPPCDGCAFVLGTDANRSAATILDAIKCVAESVPFHCHKGIPEGGEPKLLCAGWVAMAARDA